jgi:hypothetical protein
VQDVEQGAALHDRTYKAKGFIISVEGENRLEVKRDDGSSPDDILKWKNGTLLELVHGNSTMYISLVVDTEDKPAISESVEEQAAAEGADSTETSKDGQSA